MFSFFYLPRMFPFLFTCKEAKPLSYQGAASAAPVYIFRKRGKRNDVYYLQYLVFYTY